LPDYRFRRFVGWFSVLLRRCSRQLTSAALALAQPVNKRV